MNEHELIDLELLRGDHLQLSREAMRKVGPAAQTLAGLYRLAGQNQKFQTFASHKFLAELLCLPVRTVKDHLVRLRCEKWIHKKGRERLSPKARCSRRTVTWQLSQKAVDNQKPFDMLPRFLAQMLYTSWAQRAVIAVVVSRHSLIDSIENGDCGGFGSADDRYAIPLSTFATNTGLSNPSIIKAKWRLCALELIHVEEGDPGFNLPDFIQLNGGHIIDPDKLPKRMLQRRRPVVTVADTVRPTVSPTVPLTVNDARADAGLPAIVR